MADSEARPQTETDQGGEKSLKYLDFVQVAAIYAVVCFLTLYDYAKENSGPLKPGVQTVEGTVKTVIGPVYEKFHDIPFELLRFVDRKVDDSITELDRHVPSLVKQTSCVARAVASEVQRAGVVDTAKHITENVYAKYKPKAKELYTKYEPVAEQYAVSAWRSLNQLPLFPQVSQIVIPTAAYWSEKYNLAVNFSVEKGCAVALYLPLIPIERIAKVFDEESENETNVSSNGAQNGPSTKEAENGPSSKEAKNGPSESTNEADNGPTTKEAKNEPDNGLSSKEAENGPSESTKEADNGPTTKEAENEPSESTKEEDNEPTTKEAGNEPSESTKEEADNEPTTKEAENGPENGPSTKNTENGPSASSNEEAVST